MSPHSAVVDVCVATFRRPEMLRALLAGLQAQRLPPHATARLIVIDNDSAGSAREEVLAAAIAGPYPVTYAIESKQGISHARNHALRLATGTHRAFIDDDEVPAVDWLSSLLDVQAASGGDAVFGPVLPDLPVDAPAWVAAGGFFDRPRHVTGTRLPHGATNNCLMTAGAIEKAGGGFNPDYALTGGEDTEFFLRLKAAGGILVWCDEAVVRETVPTDRARLGWLLRRHFRGGQTFSRLTVPRLSPIGKAGWAAKRLAILGGATVLAAPLWFGGRVVGTKGLLALARQAGQLTAFTFRFQEYRTPRSRGL
ncbi:glycosyltransferase family 2 protein [Lacibacterium aquatile]|uniref:Glycosyltransferase family 2 protein n=1 Tax=Lacibacterium aquatile TaxID=1168082 RepID=A0ABW5DX56_9PROT